MSILSVNAGSSSLKFALYPTQDDAVLAAEVTGNIEGLEPQGTPRVSLCVQSQREAASVTVAAGQEPFEAALQHLKQLLHTRFAHISLQAVAHRVVHGGAFFSSSVVVTPDVLSQLRTLSPLAPLHQPHNLAGVAAFAQSFQDLPQVACFDTAFHSSLPPLETTFAIDRTLTQQGVRRYGFHGLSYQYVSQVLQQHSPASQGATIMAHLGNGASLCATRAHRSCATTMGFSALDGLMMGTRSGALDPGVLLYLLEQGWDHARLQQLLYKQSGLLGVSGQSADMRTLRASALPAAKFATDLFAHRVVREIGALSAAVGGLNVLAFTGGIGEHDALLRAQVAHALGHMGVSVDTERNQQATGDAVCAIHDSSSRVEVWVVPTDEGRVAAQEALAITRKPS